MNQTLKLAIRSALTNDAQYILAMGSPTTSPYNTYWKNPPKPPSFPQVVYWLRPGQNDKSNDRNLMSIVYDLHVWIWVQGDTETISNRIIYLLHQKGNSEGFRSILDREVEELYDEELNAWGLHLLFNLFHRREII
jgi:hypothetical protein